MIGMSIAASIWGCRLTFQFLMKDGYTLKGEDYRWKYIKAEFAKRNCSRIFYHLFNLFFIVVYQSILLLLLVVPQLVLVGQDLTMTIVDGLLLGLYLGLVITETIADHQQQDFQYHKYKAIENKLELQGDFKDGFVRSGLFRICRHPNFVCEVLLWWVFASLTLSRCGFNWSFIGAFSLSFLFTGSQDLTEQISCRKYPCYAEYQKIVPSFIPNVQIFKLTILSDGSYKVTSTNEISRKQS